MATPRTATLTGTVTWSDGTLFDGYLLIGIALPTNGDGDWPYIAADGITPPQRLPQWIFIPIKQGVIDAATKLWYNADLNPPGTQYVAYWYDSLKRLVVSGVPTPFTISTASHAISLPTITVPNNGTVPTPQDTGV